MSEQIPGYRVIRKINRGGMSTVYLAVQLSVGREVALKIMAPVLNADPVFSERFQREANIVGQLSHPNIVSIYDIGRRGNLNYIAMDYLPGGTLNQRMMAGINESEALCVLEEMALALDHAHERGYIHRDIKPDNILFRHDGSAVLTDFGVARTLETDSSMTVAGTIVGTPYYMSPEQGRGKPLDGRSDLYSLGVVLYEMLTGSVPYRAEDPVAVAIKHLTAPVPKLPAQLAHLQPLLNRMMAKEREDRFQRGREIVAAIRNPQSLIQQSHTTSIKATDPAALQILRLLRSFWRITPATIRWQFVSLFSRSGTEPGVQQLPVTLAGQPAVDATTAFDERATVISDPRSNRSGHGPSSQTTSRPTILRWSLVILLPVVAVVIGLTLSARQDSEPAPEKQSSALERSADAIDSGEPGETFAVIEEERPDEQAIAVRQPLPASPTRVAQPRTYSLTVNTQPAGARVRVLNIRERYQPGIELPPGSYQIEVSHPGYDTLQRWIKLDDEDRTLLLQLRASPVAGSIFHDRLSSGDNGPPMVVVPAGKFTMGDASLVVTSPLREVRFDRPFAVSRFEITFADYEKYAAATSARIPDDKRWGRHNRPVINVSWQEAQGYVQWLGEQTGKNYRLLTESEWEYVARANTTGNYFWGDSSVGDNQAPANCRRECNSPFSNLLRTKTAPTGSFPANEFRLFDTAGNVAEWVQDCYRDSYQGAPTDGSAVQSGICDLRVVRGGSIRGTLKSLASHARDARSAGRRYADVGLRIAVDL